MKNLLKKKFPHLFIGFYVFMAALLTMSLVVPGMMLDASNLTDFTNNGAPTTSIGPGANNVLVMDVVIPDGVNGGAADTLIYDGSSASYTGDTLISMTGSEYYLDDDGNVVWNESTIPGTDEAVWVDANGNILIESSEIQLAGLAGLEPFSPAGVGAEYVFDDIATDQGPGVAAADYDAAEAVWKDFDGDGLMGPADILLRDGTAAFTNFTTWEAINGPICGLPAGGCHNINFAVDFYWCDGPGGVADGGYTPGESIFIDFNTGGLLGDYDLGVDLALTDPTGALNAAPSGSCVIVGGTPISLTLSPPQPVGFLDTDKSVGISANAYGDVLAAFPLNEPIVWLIPPTTLADGAPITTASFAAIAPSDPDTQNPANAANAAWDSVDWILMSAARSNNLSFIGISSAPGDAFTGQEAIVDDGLGSIPGVLEPGEIISGDQPPLFRGSSMFGLTFHQKLTFGPTLYTHTGAGFFDSTEDLYIDTVNSAQVDTPTDQLTAITLQNIGSAVDSTDIATVEVWTDGTIGGWDSGSIPADNFLGTAVWDGVDSWDLSGLSQTIPGGGLRIFVSVDVAAAPPATSTIKMQIPRLNDDGNLGGGGNGVYDAGDEGLFVQSINDGPADAAVLNVNTQTIDLSRPNLININITDLVGSALADGVITPAEADGVNTLRMTVDFDKAMDVSLAALANLVFNTSPYDLNNATSLNPVNIAVNPAQTQFIVDSIIIPGGSEYGTISTVHVSGLKDTFGNLMNPYNGTFKINGTTQTLQVSIGNPSGGITVPKDSIIDGEEPADDQPLPAPEQPTDEEPADEEPADEEPVMTLPTGVDVGMAIRLANSKAVYLIGNDKKRHPFPDEKTFMSWFSNYNNVTIVSDSTMSAIPMGKNVVMRAGTYLIKITTVDKVYAVEPDGVIRWIESEELAEQLYGENWNNWVVDVADVFFADYLEGDSIAVAVHPSGALIQYAGEPDIYLVEKGMKKYVTGDVFADNLYQDKFVIKNLSDDITYVNGGLMESLTLAEILPY